MPRPETSLRPQARPADLAARAAALPEGQPQVVRLEATRRVQYDPTRPRLIGIFGREDAPNALLRLPSGLMRRVARGDRIGAATVAAIDAEAVILVQGGRTERIAMPAS